MTHRDHRQRGYGSQILDAATNAAWSLDCYKVILMTGAKARATLNFYARAGFEQSKTGFEKRRLPAWREGWLWACALIAILLGRAVAAVGAQV